MSTTLAISREAHRECKELYKQSTAKSMQGWFDEFLKQSREATDGNNKKTTAVKKVTKKKSGAYPAFVQTLVEQQVFDYRKSIKKPIKTKAGLNGVINAIRTCSDAWGVDTSDVWELMTRNEWQTVKEHYSNPWIVTGGNKEIDTKAW